MKTVKRKATIARLIAGFALGLACCGDPDLTDLKIERNPEAEQAGAESARAWLALLDDGRFAESWKQSADYFQAVVSQEEWEKTIGLVRTPLGAVVSREVETKDYATALPGAPDGEYVVVQFRTVFENKAHAVETVTPRREEDGVWRVSGYYLD